MKKNRNRIKYWLIPMLAVVCVCGGLSVGKTTARRNVVAGNLVFLQEQQLSIYSNLLMPQGQTVLLDAMETDGERKLNLETLVTGGDCTAMLTFQYLDQGNEIMEPIQSAIFPLADGTTHNFTFQIKPMVQYLEAEQEIFLEVSLEIYAGQSIQGEMVQSVSAVFQTAVNANPEPVPTETTEPVETTEPAETTESAETTEPVTVAAAGQTDAETKLSGMLTGMTEIVSNGLQGICVTAPDAETEVHIAMLGDTQMTELFAKTRYRMQGSEAYVMLYDSDVITLPAGTAEPQLLVLDYSQLEETMEGKPFHLVAYTDTGYISDYLTVSPVLQMPDVLSNEAPLVVTEKVPLKVEIPAFWQGTTLKFEIQRLFDETEHMPVGTLENGMLTVTSEDGTAAPGTYQLLLRWYYGQSELSEGVLIAEEAACFMVNYTAFVQPEREQIQFPTTEPTAVPGEEEIQ